MLEKGYCEFLCGICVEVYEFEILYQTHPGPKIGYMYIFSRN